MTQFVTIAANRVPVLVTAAGDHGPSGRTTRVVLATAHIDHHPFNNVPENLTAVFHRCNSVHGRE